MNDAPVRLVIFDCDGVLVDSEPISVAVLRETIAGAGGDIGEDDAYRLFLGRSMASIAETLTADFGLELTAAHLEAMRRRLFARFKAELVPIDGIGEALAALGVPFCVASSSQPDRIRLSLDLAGLRELFEPHVFSSAMVENGKPAPDLFLHAASRMGAAPRDCVVVEDSPAGVEAARRAGMAVLAYVGGSHAVPGDLRQAIEALAPDAVFDDMRRLPELLDAMKRAGGAQ